MSRTLLFTFAFVCIFAGSARSDDYPFSGLFAHSVTPEALTEEDFRNTCNIAPFYDNLSGEEISLKLDLSYFRETGLLRYRMEKLGYQRTYYQKQKVIVVEPLKETVQSFKGNPYYAPKARYNLVTSVYATGYTYLSFRSSDAIKRALATGDLRAGNRGALKRCPKSEKEYLAITIDETSLPPLSKDERGEHFELLYNNRNPNLLKKISAAFSKLE